MEGYTGGIQFIYHGLDMNENSIIKHLIFPERNYQMFSNLIIKHPNISKIQL